MVIINHELWCKNNLNLDGKIYYREAVRGIILKENKILLVYSDINKDYKFPGGGIEDGEDAYSALKREILEESGAHLISHSYFGQVIEYDDGQFDNADVFRMLSKYYLVEIKEDLSELNLDHYEEKLKFHPVWVDIKKAYEENKRILEGNNPPRWTKRETFVLEYLIKHFT